MGLRTLEGGELRLGAGGGLMVAGESGAPSVELPTALFDLDERVLDEATTVDLGGGVTLLTAWPDGSGNGISAIIDPDDGSDETGDNGGFIVDTDNGHTTVTARYPNDRLTVKTAFPSPDENGDVATVLYLVTLGDDAPVDGTEMCPLTFDPSSGSYYQDTYVYDADRESSEITGYEFGEQFGGPQVGDTYIVTRVHTVDNTVPGHLPLSHIDGFEATPQTDFAGSSGDIFGPDVMIANYPGGGYTLPGRWRRVVAYPGRLSAAQRLLARQMLAAQALEDGIVVTLYDETGQAASDLVGIVLAPDSSPYVGAEVYAIATSDYSTLATGVTLADGSYTVPGIPYNVAVFVAAHPTSTDESITYPTAFDTSVGYLNSANAFTPDGSGDPIDVGTFTMLEGGTDPTTDPDLVESYDSDDLSSLTVVAGRATAWAAQQPGRPAFVLASGTGPTSGARTLDGANVLGFTGGDKAVLTAAGDSPSGGQTIILVGVRDETGPDYPAFNTFLNYDTTHPLLAWYLAGQSYILGHGDNEPSGVSVSYSTLGAGFVTVFSFGAGGGDPIASTLNDAIEGDPTGTAWTNNPAWTDLNLIGDAGYTWAVRYVARIARKVSIEETLRMVSWMAQTMLPDD